MNETATQLHTTDNSNATNNNNNINNNNNAKMDRSVSPTPSEQQYSLKWNDFQSSILSSFRHLRDEEDFVDVTLACEQRSFRAHKVVLSACSPYFRKLLKANPCEHPIVILRDVRSEDVESLLRFMYNGEVNIGQDQLSDFLKTSQLLQVRGLADVTNPSRTSNSTLNSSLSTPAVQELKASPTSTSLPWELPEDTTQPPPQKRTKSSDLYRKQHGLSPEAIALRDSLPGQQHSLTRERDRSRDSRDMRDRDRERDRSLELRESLLGQALEGGPTLIVPPPKHPDLPASAGEDSNSSDTAASDHGDYDGTMDGMNGSMEPTRPSFPSAFLGLPGLPGLLPGPSGMHGDNFELSKSHQTMGNFFGSISRHNTHETLQHLSMDKEMRVRATDPRPCPKCGKIYRSAHTLRTHLEDKHTVCPGYRCVLCGTVAKSRNSLHSHMSRQHRGISTKDLPVLPMPSPFDPDLASRLLAKAGVKISPAELRARASPTGTRRSDMKLELRSGDDDFDDPEDLTMSQGGHNENSRRYHESMMGLSPTMHYNNLAFNHPNTTITRVRHGAVTPKSIDSMSKESHGGVGDRQSSGHHMQHNAATGSAILDTYLQFITENTFGMGMTQEQAAAAIHAAKMAQLNAMGHNLDKLPPGFLPPQLDIAKISSNNNQNNTDISINKIQSTPSVTIEPTSRDHHQSNNNSQKLHSLSSGMGGGGNGNHNLNNNIINSDTIRRGDSSEPMDLGLDGPQNMHNDDANSSGDERNYSDDEGVATN